MLALSEIENAVEQLPRKEFISFSSWFEKIEAERWDREIEEDVEMGLLDSLADEAIEEYKNGSCQEL